MVCACCGYDNSFPRIYAVVQSFILSVLFPLQLIPIETSMAESKHRFPLYLHFAIGGLSAILACFGMLGYLVYGEEVAQIVTRSFHPGPLVLVVQCLLCFAILLTYPLQLVPIIEIVESWLFKSEAKNAITTESSLNNDLSTSSDDVMISQVDTKSVTVNECSRLLAPEIPKEKSRVCIVTFLLT